MMTSGMTIDLARRAGTVALGLAVLWQVAERAGRKDGEVVVHVAAANAEVRIDDRAYEYDPYPASPIVRPLRPGTHRLTLTREGRLLHDETFTLESGGQVVLTAWDRFAPTVPQPVPSPGGMLAGGIGGS
jgi:hypothetical protein